MPTENRSSNSEMVSVPRDEVERLVKLLAYQAHPYPSPHAEYWEGILDQSSEHDQGKPVSLPGRATGFSDVASGWNKCLDRIEALGPLYTHADPGEVEGLRAALKFYADRDHFAEDIGSDWDSVSGEPANVLWHEHEAWFVEDGSIARAALERLP